MFQAMSTEKSLHYLSLYNLLIKRHTQFGFCIFTDQSPQISLKEHKRIDRKYKTRNPSGENIPQNLEAGQH